MWAWLRSLWLDGTSAGSGYLLSEPEFRVVLEHERMRADRSGTEFALVLFGFRGGGRPAEPRQRLERILQGRLRATDVAGVSQGRVGVLLPETPEEGARKVVADVEAGWHGAVVLRAEVIVYPTHTRNGTPLRATSSCAGASRREVAVGAASHAAVFTQPLPAWKRCLDLCGASAGLVVLAPVMLLVAVMVWISSGRPILFKQLRAGLGGRPFWMYKFRTMCPDAEQQQARLRPFSEQDGPAFKLRNDPRLTPLGRWLRRLSLDELPQLWNVLRGEMSLVGPRPLPCGESEGCHGWHRRRLDVTPGLTCLWQVSGRSQVSFDEWVRMDVRYINARSLATDLWLMLRTVPAVVMQKGAQ